MKGGSFFSNRLVYSTMADNIPSNKSLLGQILRLPLKLIPNGATVPILRGAERGKKWIVGSGPHSNWLGINEVAKRRLMAQVIKPGTVVYDIGANVGSYTILTSVLTGDSGNVYAFEPLPDNLQYLHRHIKLNNLHNIEVHEVAVWNKSGTVKFQGTSDRVTSHISDEGSIEVKTVSIDSLVFDGPLSPPDIIKIDVEGAETGVLEGAQKTLKKYQPSIFLATHGDDINRNCREQLEKLGYTIQKIDNQEDELLAQVSPG